MNIVGERIFLRAIEPFDSSMLLDLINDPETERLLGGSSFPVSKVAQDQWVEQQRLQSNVLRCIIALKDNPKKGIGTIMLTDIDMRNGNAQIHIKLSNEGARGNGYGKEAVECLTRYAFMEMRLYCIWAEVLAYNKNSQRMFERCGFSKEGVLRSRVFKNGEFIDLMVYSLLSV